MSRMAKKKNKDQTATNFKIAITNVIETNNL